MLTNGERVQRWQECFEELMNEENETERSLDDAGRAKQEEPRISRMR